jgi:hypothetical protein
MASLSVLTMDVVEEHIAAALPAGLAGMQRCGHADLLASGGCSPAPNTRDRAASPSMLLHSLDHDGGKS